MAVSLAKAWRARYRWKSKATPASGRNAVKSNGARGAICIPDHGHGDGKSSGAGAPGRLFDERTGASIFYPFSNVRLKAGMSEHERKYVKS